MYEYIMYMFFENSLKVHRPLDEFSLKALILIYSVTSSVSP